MAAVSRRRRTAAMALLRTLSGATTMTSTSSSGQSLHSRPSPEELTALTICSGSGIWVRELPAYLYPAYSCAQGLCDIVPQEPSPSAPLAFILLKVYCRLLVSPPSLECIPGPRAASSWDGPPTSPAASLPPESLRAARGPPLSL